MLTSLLGGTSQDKMSIAKCPKYGHLGKTLDWDKLCRFQGMLWLSSTNGGGNAKMALSMIRIGGGMMEMESDNENENKIVKMIVVVTRANMVSRFYIIFALIYILYLYFSWRIMERWPKTRKVPCGKKNNWGAKKYHHEGVKKGFLSQATRMLKKMSREQHCSKLVRCHEH